MVRASEAAMKERLVASLFRIETFHDKKYQITIIFHFIDFSADL